jgi:outer membrane murein-binding lipoprotein Lpp
MRQEEDMVMGRSITLAVASCMLAGLAGCAATATRDNLASTADRLQQNAELLSEDAHYTPAHSDDAFSRDTHSLAADAQDFRRTVEDHRTDSGEIQASFDHLSRTYHAVRDEVNHTDNLQAQRDFRPVQDTYRDIEHELGLYPDREARADYPPPSDRY